MNADWCVRRDDPTGKRIKTFLDSWGWHIQAVALVDEDGNQLITFPVSISSLPAIEVQEVPPTNDTQNNPSFSYTYVAGDLTQIDMVIGGTTYRRTLTYVAGDLSTVSAWSEV